MSQKSRFRQPQTLPSRNYTRVQREVNKGLERRTPSRPGLLFTIKTSGRKRTEIANAAERTLTRAFAKGVKFRTLPIHEVTTGFSSGRYINPIGALFNLQPLTGRIARGISGVRRGDEETLSTLATIRLLPRRAVKIISPAHLALCMRLR